MSSKLRYLLRWRCIAQVLPVSRQQNRCRLYCPRSLWLLSILLKNRRFLNETKNTIETGIQLYLTLLQKATDNRIGRWSPVIWDHILTKRLTDDQRDRTLLSQVPTTIIDEICNKSVLNLGIVFGRFEASRNILRKLNRKWIDIFSISQIRILKLFQ